MSELTRYPSDQGIQPGWEDAEFYLCSEVDELLARRAPDPPLWLVRELRDALEQAGRSLDNADIPWPWDKSLFVRADAALAEAPKADGRDTYRLRQGFVQGATWAGKDMGEVTHAVDQRYPLTASHPQPEESAGEKEGA